MEIARGRKGAAPSWFTPEMPFREPPDSGGDTGGCKQFQYGYRHLRHCQELRRRADRKEAEGDYLLSASELAAPGHAGPGL